MANEGGAREWWKESSRDGNGLVVCGKRRDQTNAKNPHVGAKNRRGLIMKDNL